MSRAPGSCRPQCLSLLLALAVVVTAALAPLRAAAQAVVPAHDALRPVEVELNLLLDAYAQPLGAGQLLDAAWRGALEAAGHGAPAAGGAPPFPDERAAAWAEFQGRLLPLLRDGGDPAALARAANRAMARSVGDCHTRFAESYEREVQSLAGGERYGGIGVSVLDGAGFDPPAPGPVIVHILDDSPAMAAGLRLGDAVVEVDSVDTASLPTSRLAELVRGLPGSAVTLRVDRPGTPEPVEVTVERAVVEVTLLEWRFLAPASPEGLGIGYVKLRGFAPSVETALPDVLEQLRAQGAGGWVLDLRDNAGGRVATFTRVASLFIREGLLAVTIDRTGAEGTYAADGTSYRAYMRPLAVLVDRHTASAAELLAGDLQDYGAARVFGAPTAGCFGVSQLSRLPDGSALWLTITALQTGGARRDVHRVGVTPDETVGRTRYDLASGRDPQLARALTWVRARLRAGEAGATGTGKAG